MTKDKYIYELIDKCMLITCQDNILVENFELRDDSTYYSENEKQFYNCIKFFLEHTTIPDKKKKYEELETELQRQDITSEYIIKKIKEYRNLEQN